MSNEYPKLVAGFPGIVMVVQSHEEELKHFRSECWIIGLFHGALVIVALGALVWCVLL